MGRRDEQKPVMHCIRRYQYIPNNGTFKSICWTFVCRLTNHQSTVFITMSKTKCNTIPKHDNKPILQFFCVSFETIMSDQCRHAKTRLIWSMIDISSMWLVESSAYLIYFYTAWTKINIRLYTDLHSVERYSNELNVGILL